MIIGVLALTLLQAPVVPHAEVAPLRQDLLAAIEVIEGHLAHMRALARVVASDPTLTPAERMKFDAKFQAYAVRIDRTAYSTFWRKVPLLDSSVPMLELQVRPDGDETVPLLLVGLTTPALAITGDLTGTWTAWNAWNVVGTAISQAVTFRVSATQTFAIVLGARPWSAPTSGSTAPQQPAWRRSSASAASAASGSSSSGGRQVRDGVRDPRSAPRRGSGRGSALGSRGAGAIVAL